MFIIAHPSRIIPEAAITVPLPFNEQLAGFTIINNSPLDLQLMLPNDKTDYLCAGELVNYVGPEYCKGQVFLHTDHVHELPIHFPCHLMVLGIEKTDIEV